MAIPNASHQTEVNMSFDLSWRPKSYWSPESHLHAIQHTIAGTARREFIERVAGEEEHPELIAPLLDEHLSPAERTLWGRVHPSFMGGEYLPKRREGEVEIARLEFASVTADVISIRALPHRYGLSLAIVDEYETDFVFTPKWQRKTLTLGQIQTLINTAKNPDEDSIFPKGLVFPCIDRLAQEGSDLDFLRRFIQVRSSHYPELESLFEHKLDIWYRRKMNDREEY